PSCLGYPLRGPWPPVAPLRSSEGRRNLAEAPGGPTAGMAPLPSRDVRKLTDGLENHHSSITGEAQFGKPLHFWKSGPKCPVVVSLDGINGGGAWESNPPIRLFAGHAGFEVQEAHQVPVRPPGISHPEG